MQVVDAHLDIAYNALKYGRDPLLTVAQLRAQEKPDRERGTATVAIPQLREAGAVLIFGTLFAAPTTSADLLRGDTSMTYVDAQQAHRLAMDQLDFYRRLADLEQNCLRLVTDLSVLDEVIGSQQDQNPLLGILVSMEGADPIREPGELEMWVEKGLRAVGLAWDDTRYAAGAWRPSRHGLADSGLALLEVMADYNIILDLSHMSELASLQALERYTGPIIASHSNARALVPEPRQLSDPLIRGIGEHEGVMGVALYNPYLRANHQSGDPRQLVTLNHVVAHIDHICQLLGDADHVGLGTDMDGGFGAENIPTPLDTIADMPLLALSLQQFGYEDEHIVKIMGGNWLNLLRSTLPQ